MLQIINTKNWRKGNDKTTITNNFALCEGAGVLTWGQKKEKPSALRGDSQLRVTPSES